MGAKIKAPEDAGALKCFYLWRMADLMIADQLCEILFKSLNLRLNMLEPDFLDQLHAIACGHENRGAEISVAGMQGTHTELLAAIVAFVLYFKGAHPMG
jgi:hypothetical protein